MKAPRTLILLLALTASAVSAPAQPPSPLDVHRQLRSRLHRGEDVSRSVREWTARTGDHSFDGLREPSKLNRRALQRQLEALAHWDGSRLDEAIRAYEDAADIALRAGNPTEADFCRYYIAEVLVQQDRLQESLERIEGVLRSSTRDRPPRPYLEALLLQSRGYTLWLMDRLRAALHSFGEAQKRWARLSFADGTAANWNNLAGLHEDLGSATRAERCYRMALKTADESVFPEIRLQIHSNFALFLAERGRRSEALEHLESAREWRSADPLEFLLLARRLLRDEASKRELEGLADLSGGQEIERLLTLAETESDFETALKLFRRARDRAREGPHRRWRRLSALKMGDRLEREGRFQQAAASYHAALGAHDFATRPEFIFPYSQIFCPAFDGWVRSLIALRRPDLAWSEIQRRQTGSRVRALRFMRAPPATRPPAGDDLERFLEAIRLDSESDPDFPAPAPAMEPPSPPDPQGRHCVVELWPDDRRVFAWVANRGGFHFRILETERTVADLVSEVVDPFYEASDSLPPWPDRRDLRRLYDQLILPLRPLLDSDRLLFVGRKELESLPIEMLLDEDGRFLLESFSVSYLPQTDRRAPARLPPEPPLAILPDLAPPSEAGIEKEFFRRLFPEARMADSLNALDGRRARWIHVSSHLDLDPDFWLGSPLGFNPGADSLPAILRPKFACRLLSLGICDAANSHRWSAPYWLSLAEPLLTREIDALLLSRWKLDELSSRVYRDFFRLCGTGMPMDRALAEARRQFQGDTLHRQSFTAPASHPYFWAGISYVGPPGLRLYPDRERRPVAAILLAVAVGLGALVRLLKR